MRVLGIVALGLALSGCAIERAQIAQQAQTNMIGMPKEQVLACMGPPANKATEGKTEVWAYSTNPTINLDRGSGSTRYCNINITINVGAVSAVNYQGPTGGLISQGEQCAYAVDACVRQR
jgi:outer membrane protein assembly factor BamE (lipoprotein component of BamABCDE complex)